MMLTDGDDSAERGVMLALHDGKQLYMATDQAKGTFWHDAAWKLSKSNLNHGEGSAARPLG
jgi:hypothetical protein